MTEESTPVSIPNQIDIIKRRQRALSHPSPPDVNELRKIQELKHPKFSKLN